MRPTVVVGIGEAGLRMASMADTVFEEEGVDERDYEILAIDTNSSDIEGIFPELNRDEQRVLTVDDDQWEDMQNRWAYLQSGDTAGQTGGATRTRPVGRAHVDAPGNFGSLFEFFDTRLEDFFDESHKGSSDGNVFLVNALGGGTGSGTFLLIGSILRRVSNQLGTNCYISGIGSLPRLTHSETGFFGPGKPKHYVNSYTALEELQAVIEHDYDSGPLEIAIESNPDQALSDKWKVPEPPFNKYVLLAASLEEVGDQNTQEQINRIAANAIFYLAEARGIEDFPDSQEHKEDILLTVDATELKFPYYRAEKYIYQDEVTEVLEEKKHLIERLEDLYQHNNSYVSDVVDLGRASDPPANSAVENFVVSTCRDKASNPKNIQRLTRDVLEANIQSTVESLLGKISIDQPEWDALADEFDVEPIEKDDLTRPEEISREKYQLIEKSSEIDIDEIKTDVIKLLYLRQIQRRLNRELESNDFPSKVGALWSRHRGSIQEAEMYEGRSEEEKWEEVLYSHLNRVIAKYDNTIEEKEDGFFGGVFGNEEVEELKEKRKKVKETLKSVDRLHSDQNHILDMMDYIDDMVTDVRDRVEEHQNDLQSLLQELENELQITERNLERERNVQESLADESRDNSLLQFAPGKFAEMQLNSVEGLTDDALVNLRERWNIDDLIARDIISEDDLRDNLNVMFKYLEERVLDNKDLQYMPHVVLAPMINSDNANWESEVKSIADASQNLNIGTIEDTANIQDRLTIRLLAFFANIDLEMSSEYGTLREHYIEEGKDMSRVLGEPEPDDVEIEEDYVRFAYPELLGDEVLDGK